MTLLCVVELDGDINLELIIKLFNRNIELLLRELFTQW